ncbi:RipA family octameric membrane protein (plasmid) [Clostridium perfringens]|uniref:Uncharacterized protein n=1 Tax=Clostridium perfringens TaxID=1502 RepID=A0AAN5NDL1_CLOPF|nr:hypothetical protein [Clostridium perfringens]EDS81516.1 putative small integral membrane protein [Clostridium perfringens C str. JGS1495]ELC8345888.1 hypothetical protein [Clostridium perfringens]ELC8384719.1 hypothetical protein [Clostridium perfringens]MCR1964654.1 hypothetical protein [Clostridium perfringens]MDK0681231.1 hypothetical protein [Clostridium perfringens]
MIKEEIVQEEKIANKTSHLIDQWKVYVQMADNISERRGKNNNFFVTLNTTIITLSTTNFIGIEKSLVNILGIVLSIIWILSIKNYAKLNEAKFSVINSIENYLEIQGFKEEWEYLEINKYSELSNLEKWVPIIFILINIILYVQS